jgi:hypothetical protein
MSGQAKNAPPAARTKRMPDHLGRVTESPDIPRDGRHGNPPSIHKFNGKIPKQKLQSVKSERFPVDAPSLPCRRHESSSLGPEDVRQMILSQSNSRACFVLAESAELVGTVREVRNDSSTCFSLMGPPMKKYFTTMARYPFSKTVLRVKTTSMPVRNDRRRDRPSDQWFKSGNNFPDVMRVSRAYVVNDDNEPPSCSACSGKFGSIDDAHGETGIASWPSMALYRKESITHDMEYLQYSSDIVEQFVKSAYTLLYKVNESLRYCFRSSTA